MDFKVSDFELSALKDHVRPHGLPNTVCDTPAYVGPEGLAKKGFDGAKVDRPHGRVLALQRPQSGTHGSAKGIWDLCCCIVFFHKRNWMARGGWGKRDLEG